MLILCLTLLHNITQSILAAFFSSLSVLLLFSICVQLFVFVFFFFAFSRKTEQIHLTMTDWGQNTLAPHSPNAVYSSFWRTNELKRDDDDDDNDDDDFGPNVLYIYYMIYDIIYMIVSISVLRYKIKTKLHFQNLDEREREKEKWELDQRKPPWEQRWWRRYVMWEKSK